MVATGEVCDVACCFPPEGPKGFLVQLGFCHPTPIQEFPKIQRAKVHPELWTIPYVSMVQKTSRVFHKLNIILIQWLQGLVFHSQ